MAYYGDTRRAYKAKLLATGRCVDCTLPRAPGRKRHCDRCAKQRADGVKKRWHRRMAAGLCPKCGGELDREDRRFCDRCRARNAASHRKTRGRLVASAACPTTNTPPTATSSPLPSTSTTTSSPA